MWNDWMNALMKKIKVNLTKSGCNNLGHSFNITAQKPEKAKPKEAKKGQIWIN